ncbi:MAG: hypothetical protein LUI85_04035, partial [Bacteroides sp.]|nr:hypothetical protein [Bacteroides sp.]
PSFLQESSETPMNKGNQELNSFSFASLMLHFASQLLHRQQFPLRLVVFSRLFPYLCKINYLRE